MINEPGYRLNVGLIVINDKGKLLLCKRKNIDSWQFPQGGIDFGESPLKASKRELYEEVGIKSSDVKLISSTNEWFKYDVPHGFHIGILYMLLLNLKKRYIAQL
jgi:putative (di)nucleoside polyphosphate hydrolase